MQFKHLILNAQFYSNKKKTCFCFDEKWSIVSNQFNQGGLSWCCQDSSAQKQILSMQRNLVDNDSNLHGGAKSLELLFCGPSHDVFGADVYYHQFYENKESADDYLNFEKEMLVHLMVLLKLKLSKEKNAYLLHELLKD